MSIVEAGGGICFSTIIIGSTTLSDSLCFLGIEVVVLHSMFQFHNPEDLDSW